MRKLIDLFNRACIRAYIEFETASIDAAEAVRELRTDLHFKLAALRLRDR